MSQRGPWTLVLLFVFASLTVTAPTTQAQLGGSGSLEGMVCTDAEKECWQGLPDVALTLTRTDGVLPDSYSTSSDEGGWFMFADVPQGSYDLAASRTGFVSANMSLQVDGDERVDLSLESKAISVSLLVVDDEGDGLDALVSWDNDHGAGSVQVQDGVGTLATRSGYHGLQVESPGFERQNHWILLDGSDLKLSLEPVPPQNAALHGTVLDQDGQPVEGAVVNVYQYGQRYSDTDRSSVDGEPHADPLYERGYQGGENRTVTAADGSYRIHVWDGDVQFNVHKDGHARRSAYLQVDAGQDLVHDVELTKFPAKTAHIEGRVLGSDGKALENVRLSLWFPEYGVRECSTTSKDGSSASGAPGQEPAGDAMITYPGPDYDSGCSIVLRDDGTFEGDVMPGYVILEAWHDHWRSCSESSSSDGSMSRTCGPEYLGYARTLTLPADTTTKLSVQMKARPAADATVSGYVVDGESKKAISGVQVQFNNEETYGWGSAGTDRDGSYKVRVRAGYHHVNVWADGYLPWQGTIQIPAGGDMDLDILLTPGETQYGDCCYAYADDVAYASADAESIGSDGQGAPTRTSAPQESGDQGNGGEAIQDLGGGLGPYDASKRSQSSASVDNGAPAPGLALLGLSLLGAVLVARRHR